MSAWQTDEMLGLRDTRQEFMADLKRASGGSQEGTRQLGYSIGDVAVMAGVFDIDEARGRMCTF